MDQNVSNIYSFVKKNVYVRQRPKRTYFSKKIEFESKFNVRKKFYLTVFENIINNKKFDPYKYNKRSEIHEVYSITKNYFSILMFAYFNKSDLWIKEKSKNFNVIYTEDNIPILQRKERIFNPTNKNYQQKIKLIRTHGTIIGKFRKFSLDLYFTYKKFDFTLTYNIINIGKKRFDQFELEFNAKLGNKKPTINEITNIMHQVINIIFPNNIATPTIERKVDWLIRKDAY